MQALPGIVVSCLCLWLGFVRTSLELVKVRQLFPVVVLVLIRVIMVGAHNVISYTGLRLLRCRGSVKDKQVKCKEETRGGTRLYMINGQNEEDSMNNSTIEIPILSRGIRLSEDTNMDLPKGLLLIQVAQGICFRDYSACFQRYISCLQ